MFGWTWVSALHYPDYNKGFIIPINEHGVILYITKSMKYLPYIPMATGVVSGSITFYIIFRHYRDVFSPKK